MSWEELLLSYGQSLDQPEIQAYLFTFAFARFLKAIDHLVVFIFVMRLFFDIG